MKGEISRLKRMRERHNLTQQELCEKSGISVRTIQRIESGQDPKGQTLKILARTLEVEERELLEKSERPERLHLIKFINFSSLPVTIFPPANILLPLMIMLFKKEFNPLTRQILSLQILWTLSAGIIFMLSAFAKSWFSLGSDFVLVVMILLVLSNVFIILRNAAEIDKTQRLRIRLNFSII